jgi:hypothetical protein
VEHGAHFLTLYYPPLSALLTPTRGGSRAAMAANAILNVLDNGYGHYIIVMNDEAECGTLLAVGKGRIDSCAWMSGPMRDQPTDPFVKPSDIHVRGVPVPVHTHTGCRKSSRVEVLTKDALNSAFS